MCGFSWSGPRAYHRYGCLKGGAHPPVPFALGGLQVLSAPLVSFLAASADVAAFVAQADATLDYNEARRMDRVVNDDVMLGYWLAAAPRAFNVTYAFVNALTPNADCPACRPGAHCRGNGMYKPPNNASVLLHNIKNPRWLPYVWSVVAEGAEYRTAECRRANADQRSETACVARYGTAGHVAAPRVSRHGGSSLLRT